MPDQLEETRKWVFEASDPATCSHDTVMKKAPGEGWTCSACGVTLDPDKVREIGLGAA